MLLLVRTRNFGLFLLVVSTVLLLNGCIAGSPASTRQFTTEDLLLTEADVPANWHLARIAPLGPSIGFGDEEDDREAMFTQPNDEQQLVFASHIVLHFDTQQQAARWYAGEESVRFDNNRVSVERPWWIPQDLSYQSSFAEHFHVACMVGNMVDSHQVCSMLGQYEEYVVILHSRIEPNWIDVAGFNSLVGRVDEIMMERLG